MRTSFRVLGFALLAVAAGAVFVVLRPTVVTDRPTLPSATQYESPAIVVPAPAPRVRCVVTA